MVRKDPNNTNALPSDGTSGRANKCEFNKKNTKNNQFKNFVIGGALAFVGLMFLACNNNNNNNNDSNSGSGSGSGSGRIAMNLEPPSSFARVHDKSVDVVSSSSSSSSSHEKVIREGEIADVPYLHCAAEEEAEASSPSSSTLTSLVMLHGAAFTKEDWRDSGIFEALCEFDDKELRKNHRRFSVTALDLPNGADDQDLRNVLDAMTNGEESMMTVQLPVALVTPSMSGRTVASWIKNDNGPPPMSDYIRQWIPVAAGAVLTLDDSQLEAFRSLSMPNILAIHGDEDRMGKKVSQRLASVAKAKVVELVGTHPCYLDSPIVFTQTLADYLSLVY